MKPDASKHNPDPDYLRGLVTETGMSQRAVATQIGISDRLLRYYLSRADDHQNAPYPVQFAIEALAEDADSQPTAAGQAAGLSR